MRTSLVLPLSVILIALAVLYLGLRSARAGSALHAARRLHDLDRALVEAVAAAEEHARDALRQHRRGGAEALALPVELDVGYGGAEGEVYHRSASTDAIRLALRGSPDPDQLVLVGSDRVAWMVPGWDARGAIAFLPFEALLDLTVDGYAAGYWARTAGAEGRRLPDPFPPAWLAISGATRVAVEAESAREFRRLLLPALLLVLVTLAAGGLVGVGLRREARMMRRRRTFLSAVTHELKTPIANISLYAETLRDHGQDDPARIPEFTDVILKEAGRLRTRVQQLLDVAAGTQAALRDSAPFDVGGSVLTVVDGARARGAQVNVELPAALLFARGPEGLFERALEEVILNASKFAPGVPARIGCREGASSITVFVDDDGPGIPSPERESVFEPFVRLGDDMTNPVPGAGLGLALVRQCLEGCGGTVSVEAAPGSTGTRVRLVLPVGRVGTSHD